MNNHPKVDFPKNPKVNYIHALSLLLIFGTLIYIGIVYPTLPEKMPSHFNLAGEADSWGGKSSIFIMPFVATVMFIGLYLVSKAPHTFNYTVTINEENAARIYPAAQFYMSLINLETVLILCYPAISSISSEFSLGIFYLPIILVMYAVTLVLFHLKLKRLE